LIRVHQVCPEQQSADCSGSDLTKPVQLVVNGTPPSGLQDTLGRFLDGGTSAVAILTKRKVTIDAVAKSPANVRLALKPSAVDVVLEREETRQRLGLI